MGVCEKDRECGSARGTLKEGGGRFQVTKEVN